MPDERNSRNFHITPNIKSYSYHGMKIGSVKLSKFFHGKQLGLRSREQTFWSDQGVSYVCVFSVQCYF